jgi:hypothetical protein
MKTGFQAMGPWEFARSNEKVLWKSIEAKYADQLARASASQKLEIHKRMVEESLRREKAMRHRPSSATLW